MSLPYMKSICNRCGCVGAVYFMVTNEVGPQKVPKLKTALSAVYTIWNLVQRHNSINLLLSVLFSRDKVSVNTSETLSHFHKHLFYIQRHTYQWSVFFV